MSDMHPYLAHLCGFTYVIETSTRTERLLHTCQELLHFQTYFPVVCVHHLWFSWLAVLSLKIACVSGLGRVVSVACGDKESTANQTPGFTVVPAEFESVCFFI